MLFQPPAPAGAPAQLSAVPQPSPSLAQPHLIYAVLSAASDGDATEAINAIKNKSLFISR